MLYDLIKPFISNEHIHEFKRGDIIYHEGDTPKELYIIKEGLVGLFHINEAGKETFLRVFGKAYILGHRSFLAEEVYHASAIAISAVKMFSLSKEEFEGICCHSKQISRTLMQILARDLGQAELRLAGFKDKSAHSRIVEALIYLKYRYPEHTWTRKEIAEYSGSTYETVTRVMTKLETEGLIEKAGRDYNILNEQSLLDQTIDFD